MSRSRAVLVSVLFAAMAVLVAALWLVRSTAGRLQLGVPVRAVLPPGAARRWRVDVAAGQYARVAIRSPAEIPAFLIDPAGLIRHPFQESDEGEWSAGWVAEKPGRWTIEVGPPATGPAVACVLELAALRPASPRDRLAWRIDRLDDRWREALNAGGERAEAFSGLVAQAVTLREKLHRGDPFALAMSFDDLAIGLLRRCSPPAAIQQQSERLLLRVVALTAGEDGDRPLWRGAALESLSSLYRDQGVWEKAERPARQALEIYQRRYGPESPETLDSLLRLASVLVDLGRFGEAAELYGRALRIVGEPRRDTFKLVARIYNELGELDRVANRYDAAEGDFEKARSYGLQALPPEDFFFVQVANNLGALYHERGEYYRAEREWLKSLAWRRSSPQSCPSDLATAELNLGEVYRQQGEYERATPYLDAALTDGTKALGDDHPELAIFYNQLAALYSDQGMYDEAAQYYAESLQRLRAALGARHPLVAQSLHDSADLEERRGRHQAAKKLYGQALSIREEFFGADNPDVAWTLTRLAAALFHDGRTAPALDAVERALGVLRHTAAHPEVQAEAYELRAEIQRRLGHGDAALADLTRSLDLVEEQRPRTGGGVQARAHFLSRYTDWFHRMIAWQVEAGRFDLAFEYAERSRARALLDQLLAARLDFLAGIPEPARRRELTRRYAETQAGLAGVERRLNVAQTAGAPPAGSLSSLLIEQDRAEQALAEVEAQIRTENPLWQAINPTSSISLASAQARLVPRDGLLLLYDVGPERSFLFAVPEAGQPAAALPLEISPATAVALGVTPGALTRDKLQRCLLGPSGEDGVLRLLGERPGPGGPAGRQTALVTALHALWEILIPPPVRAQLKDRSQVLVIPDGLLHRLPFEALVPQPGAHGFADAKFWLDAGPPLRYAASATSLAALMERGRQESRAVAARSTILSVSDPVFASPPTGARNPAAAGTTREAAERSGANLIRLPATAEETRALLEVFGSATASGTVVALQRSEADERHVRAALPDKRFIHLATHGLVQEWPGGSSVALALTPPAKGVVSTQDDGFLRLNEIYSLKLDSELAVLSACRTAFGSPLEGEGVFSLARGFHVAGARRVVASLWQVSDRATARLMGDYFQRIAAMDKQWPRPLGGYTGELLAAKRTISESGPWRDPYFWAPFILSGEP